MNRRTSARVWHSTTSIGWVAVCARGVVAPSDEDELSMGAIVILILF
jgi:hypothetical protein